MIERVIISLIILLIAILCIYYVINYDEDEDRCSNEKKLSFVEIQTEIELADRDIERASKECNQRKYQEAKRRRAKYRTMELDC